MKILGAAMAIILAAIFIVVVGYMVVKLFIWNQQQQKSDYWDNF